MKIFKQILRLAVIGVLGWTAVILAIAEPANDSAWITVFFASKTLAAVFGLAAWKLCKYWDSKGWGDVENF